MLEKRTVNFVDMSSIHEQRKSGFRQHINSTESKMLLALDGLEGIEKDMLKNHTPKISESLFLNRYLFAFAGLGSQEDNYAYYLNWITEIAKNYNIPVHVCDDTTEEILFTVPGIGNNSTINPEKSNTREVLKSISIANDMRFLQPMNWEIVLQKNLDDILLKLYDKEKASVTKEQTVWLEIFKRYEKQLVARREELKLDQPTLTQENKEDSKKVEQINYDEVDDPV